MSLVCVCMPVYPPTHLQSAHAEAKTYKYHSFPARCHSLRITVIFMFEQFQTGPQQEADRLAIHLTINLEIRSSPGHTSGRSRSRCGAVRCGAGKFLKSKGPSTLEMNWNPSRIEQTNCLLFVWQFVHSIRLWCGYPKLMGHTERGPGCSCDTASMRTV